MKKKRQRYFEKIVEGSLFLTSTLSSIFVIFIIILLFKEGIGLFNKPVIEENHIIAVNPNNPVNNLSSKQIKDIFNQDITNWKDVGGNNQDILLFTVNDIFDYYNAEEIGSEFEHLAEKINELIISKPNIIVYVPKQYVSSDFSGKRISTEKISIIKVLTGREWYPTSEPAYQFGILPLILGTLLVSFGAIAIALPIGLITALFMAEVADFRLRNFLKPVIELLAAIPSVVYGFFGLVIVVPMIQKLFNLQVGETALAGSIIIGIMALPTIITITEDALQKVPVSLREASLALGANRLQTLFRISIPYAKSGIATASILGIGRAIGETMAVLMVTGNASVIPSSFLQPVRTIPATIAAELGEAPIGGIHFKALFFLGIVLFIITMLFNLIVTVIKSKQKFSK